MRVCVWKERWVRVSHFLLLLVLENPGINVCGKQLQGRSVGDTGQQCGMDVLENCTQVGSVCTQVQ